MSNETPRQRAKREKKAYIRIIIDERFSRPGGALLDYEGPHSPERAAATQKFLLEMMK
jgi:hypothetical protein